MPRNNRFSTDSLNDLNRRRERQEHGGRVEYEGNNREARRASGDYGRLESTLRSDSMPNHFPTSSDFYSGINMLSNISPNYGIGYSNRLNNNEEQKEKYIKSHNYKPDKFIFNKIEEESDENLLYLGAEIEIDCAGENEDNAKYVIDNLEYCYTVHDGSLNNGFEIVTHPSTINYHKQMNYKEVFDWLKDKGYRSHDTRTCGLHVHVNRDYLSQNKTIQDLCITKILFLLEKYWEEISKIARRSEGQYNVKIKRDRDDDSLLDLLYKAKGSNGGYWSSAKYNCLNLLHKNTIEFRIFKGTIKYETYIATLEFVKNIVDVCKKISLEEIQSVTFEDIININETKYLLDYLKTRKLIK